MSSLAGKRIVLGVTGGIAAYKSAELVRLLKKASADVQVVMSLGAQAFITPLTLQALSGNEVRTSLLDTQAEAAMGHIELAKWAELVMVAPASANFLAKLCHGLADDLLSTLCLASAAPIAVAPAMNQQMWRAEVTQQNVSKLIERGIRIWGPASGVQACGDVGPGRMIEPLELFHQIEEFFNPAERPLAGKRVIVTAGPTYEPLDPVRFLGNRSSGKMGYALAEAFVEAGAQVDLITGPTHLTIPASVNSIHIETAAQMLSAVEKALPDTDIFVGCAAVADYRVEEIAPQKIKKSQQQLVLTLTKNPDIISKVAFSSLRPKLVVGFAAETENLAAHALDKLRRKGLDLICANDVSQETLGFGADVNRLLLISEQTPEGDDLGVASKQQLAREIVIRLAHSLKA